MDKIIDFLITEHSDRKKAFFYLLSFLFTSIITASIYQCLIGEFRILKYNELEEIKDFFMSGNVVMVIMIFVGVYYSFYNIIEILITPFIISKSNKAFRFLREVINRENILSTMKSDKTFEKLIQWSISVLDNLSVVEIKGNKVARGVNYTRILGKMNDLNTDKDSIDLEQAFLPVPITIQLIILFNSVVLSNYCMPLMMSIIINLTLVIILVVCIIIYVFNVFLEFKRGEVLDVMKKIDKTFPDNL